MDTTAVIFGVFYGMVSTAVCYVVSMLTSGLFVRSFYRLYARVLIGICCIMMLAPALRWLALTQPLAATFCLAGAQYLTVGIMGYGVFWFNCIYMKEVFLKRPAAAYFTFATLTNAAIVTLAFLQVAVSAAPNWNEQGRGQPYLNVSNYGPVILMLAAMVFHTDYHLKTSLGNLRRFSRFTFVGYAISFLGISLSLVPYVGNALAEFGLVTTDGLLLQSSSCALTLLIAIVLYAWLVWRYESIPPLFLLLMAIIGEYHVLVTQWAIRWLGTASWGLASLPLFVGLSGLNQYFSHWDRRKNEHHGEQQDEGSPDQDVLQLRFAVPFQFVNVGLGAALLCITMWTRFDDLQERSAAWLGVTFGIYACYFFALAFVRQHSQLVYLGGAIASLAALLGFKSPGEPMSALLLAVLSAAWGSLACCGSTIGLKREWRTVLTDCSFLSGIIVTSLGISRHIWGSDPYNFQVVGYVDGAALSLSALALVTCAHQYRSWLPMFGGLVAMATIAPTLTAGLGLLTTFAAAIVERFVPKENAVVLETRVRFFNKYGLPLEDVLPELFMHSLSIGSIPLALVGLVVSAAHVIHGDFSAAVMLGAAISSVVLGLLTRTERAPWLYVTSLGAGYFAIHAVAQGLVFQDWPVRQATSAHLLVAATTSLIGWVAARAHASWCNILLRRVAEEKEAAIRVRRSYYSGLLQHVTSFASIAVLLAVWCTYFDDWRAPEFMLATSAVLVVFFGLSAAVYRSQVGSYLALAASTLVVLSALRVIDVDGAGVSLVFAGLGLVAASISFWLYGWESSAATLGRENGASPLQHRLPLRATGFGLWVRPLAIYACLCSFYSVTTDVLFGVVETSNAWLSQPTLLSYAMASTALILATLTLRYPALYFAGIALAFVAAHSTVQSAPFGGHFHREILATHVMLAAALSLVSCCIATCYAAGINLRLKSADEGATAAILNNRSFYAGLLQHFALTVSALTIGGLAWSAWTDTPLDVAMARKHILAGLLLAATFSLSGAVYRSRLQTYFALTAACGAAYSCVALLVVPSVLATYQDVSLAAVAFAFGLLSWFIGKPEQRRAELRKNAVGLVPECWNRPPLPLVSYDRSLWAKPLAQVSIVVPLIAAANALRSWGRAETWLVVVPIYLAAATWFVATRTYRLGVLSVLIVEKPSDATQPSAAHRIERGILFVVAVMASGLALHATAHLSVLKPLESRLAVSWHLAIAVGLAVSAWMMATSYSIRCQRLLDRKTQPEELQRNVREDLELYAGLLHHLAAITAVAVLAAAILFGIPPYYLSSPLLAAIALLAVFFGLAGFTYRSKLGSYLSLAAVGLLTLHLASIANANWSESGSWEAAACSLLGLGLALIAQALARRTEATLSTRRWLPSAWTNSPLPLRAESWQSIWLAPLREASICYATIGLLTIVVRVWPDWSSGWANTETLIVCYGTAAIFALAARLYRTPLPTYVASTILTLSVFPLLVLTRAPMAHAGMALAALAMLVWCAGFVVERACLNADNTSDPASSLIRIYERPLIRSSAVIATLAIAISLLAWKIHGWHISQVPLAAACMLGAGTLLLGARSLRVLHQVTRARLLVYLAIAAIAACCLAVTAMTWEFNALGPAAGLTALVLESVGLILIESSRSRASSTLQSATSKLLFGEPIAHTALCLALLAVLLSGVSVVGQFVLELPWQASEEELHRIAFIPQAAGLMMAAATFLLGVRAVRDARWLYATEVFGSIGVIMLAASQLQWSAGSAVLGTLFAMNVIVLLVRLIGLQPTRVEAVLGVSAEGCEGPFLQWPVFVTTALLIGQATYLGNTLRGLATVELSWPWLSASLLSATVFFHVLYIQPRLAYVHLFVATTVLGFIGAGSAMALESTPDILLAALALAWGAVATLLDRPAGERIVAGIGLAPTEKQRERAIHVVLGWSLALMLLSAIITIPIWTVLSTAIPSTAISLLLITVGFAVGGYLWRDFNVATGSALFLPFSLAAALLFYGGPTRLPQFGGLMIVLLAIVYLSLAKGLLCRGPDDDRDQFCIKLGGRLGRLSEAFTWVAAFVAISAMFQSDTAVLNPTTAALVGVCWVWMAWDSTREELVYVAVLAFVGSFVYAIHSILQVPLEPSPVAAFSVIGLSFLLYGLNVLCSQAKEWKLEVFIRPTYYMALLTPVALIPTVPFDQKEVAALAVLAAGSFYMFIARRSRTVWALYVAALLFNVAVYIWVPTARDYTGLYQLYVIPAAVSVLIFAHLHRNELHHQALSGIRYSACGAILAVSTFEVFATNEPNLIKFIAVLVLSLLGTAAGVALRVRPFVYIGLAFLVVNVIGQLSMQFHREGGIVRAIILISAGVLILSAMIFFNVHRERILSQYKRFLADKQWE